MFFFLDRAQIWIMVFNENKTSQRRSANGSSFQNLYLSHAHPHTAQHSTHFCDGSLLCDSRSRCNFSQIPHWKLEMLERLIDGNGAWSEILQAQSQSIDQHHPFVQRHLHLHLNNIVFILFATGFGPASSSRLQTAPSPWFVFVSVFLSFFFFTGSVWSQVECWELPRVVVVAISLVFYFCYGFCGILKCLYMRDFIAYTLLFNCVTRLLAEFRFSLAGCRWILHLA